MQLIKKMFGRTSEAVPGPDSAQFHESETTAEAGSRNAPRRELIHVVLRDSMRRHGIPSAWIDCRVLSVVTRKRKTGMHVQLIVRDGVDRLLTYVPAFQCSFMEDIARFDPRVNDWLFSVSWQFQNLNARVPVVMPDPATWAASAAAPLTSLAPAAAAAPPVRQPARPPAPEQASVAAPPQQAPVAAPLPVAAADPVGDEEVLEDLQALYAIRDAALVQGRPGRAAASGQRDFESTHPGAEDGPGDLPDRRGW